MMKFIRIGLFLSFCACLAARAQITNPSVTSINAVSGPFLFTGNVSCTGIYPATCDFSGGTGTVSSFSAGNLSPLFTTSVATPTSTPNLTFSLSNAGANTVFGNPTGSSAAPSFSTSLLLSGIVDGLAPVTITTGSSASLGGTYNSGYTYNQEATASTAITYTLPTAAAGKQYCIGNSYNGSAGDTGTLELKTSASGQYIYFNGAPSASGGYVISGGALGDKGCAVGISSTQWEFYAQVGIWTLH